mgnify:CR=1 FL=1
MRINILLSVIFLIGFCLRVLYLPHNVLTFGYDQARDALVTGQILDGDLKIQGPPSSAPGLYHGVFYNYVLAPAYLLGNGSPIVAAYWIALLNAATVFIVFALTRKLSSNKYTALLAALLFAFSFEATQYATWLSNPTIGVWTVPLMYLGLWIWIKDAKAKGPILTGIGLGMSIQSEIFLAYHIVPVLFWLYFAKVKRKELFIGSFSLILSVSTMIVADAKFGFQSISGIKSLLLGSDEILQSKKFSDFIYLYFDQLARTFSNTLLPSNVGYGGLIVLALVAVAIFLWAKKRNEISPWLFILSFVLAHTTIVPVGGVSTPFLLVGIGSGVVILAALVISYLYGFNKILAIGIVLTILFSNISTIISKNKHGSVIFSIQKDMLLNLQIAAIDYTYEEANGQPFSTNSVTSPLWINIVWSYLFHWYGQEKYEFLPEWHGKDQVGLLQSLPEANVDTKNYFMIIEPLTGIPRRFIDEALDEENSRSVLVEEKYFGEILVQKRTRLEK